MKTTKLILSALAILLAIPAFLACEPSPDQMEKALKAYFDKNPQFLEQKMQEMMRKRNPEAQPVEERIKSAIQVDLNNAHLLGPENAPVTVVVFSDFQCPFCKRVVPTVHQLVKDYEGQVRVAFRHNPLPMHKNAMSAAKASLAAGEQGKFWEMHDALFEEQPQLATDEGIEKIAQKVPGLNVAKFKKDWKSTKFDAQIKADMEFARKNGATGTPAFFVNGVYLKGAKPIASFKEVIDKLLEMKGLKPAAPGTPTPAPAPAAAPTPPAQG
jgi:protein-disulfide isomerase